MRFSSKSHRITSSQIKRIEDAIIWGNIPRVRAVLTEVKQTETPSFEIKIGYWYEFTCTPGKGFVFVSQIVDGEFPQFKGYGFVNDEWKDSLTVSGESIEHPLSSNAATRLLVEEAKKRKLFDSIKFDANGEAPEATRFIPTEGPKTIWAKCGLAYYDGKWATPVGVSDFVTGQWYVRGDKRRLFFCERVDDFGNPFGFGFDPVDYHFYREDGFAWSTDSVWEVADEMLVIGTVKGYLREEYSDGDVYKSDTGATRVIEDIDNVNAHGDRVYVKVVGHAIRFLIGRCGKFFPVIGKASTLSQLEEELGRKIHLIDDPR